MPRVTIDPAGLDQNSVDVEIARLRGLDAGPLRIERQRVFREAVRGARITFCLSARNVYYGTFRVLAGLIRIVIFPCQSATG